MNTSAKKNVNKYNHFDERATICDYADEAVKIGERLRQLRGSLSVKEFSNKLADAKYAVEPQVIRKYENGCTRIPSDFLYVLAKEFQVDITYILTGRTTFDANLRAELAQLSEKYPIEK